MGPLGIDIDRLRVAPVAGERKVALPSVGRRLAGQFVAPMPLGWFQRACRLPGKAAVVAVAVWYQSKRGGSPTFVLTQAGLEGFGVSRQAKYRALARLEKAGLIAVRLRPHKGPEVTVQPWPAPSPCAASSEAQSGPATDSRPEGRPAPSEAQV